VSHSAVFDPEDEGTTIFGNTKNCRPNNKTPHPAKFALIFRTVIVVITRAAGSNVGCLGGDVNRGQGLCQGASPSGPV